MDDNGSCMWLGWPKPGEVACLGKVRIAITEPGPELLQRLGREAKGIGGQDSFGAVMFTSFHRH